MFYTHTCSAYCENEMHCIEMLATPAWTETMLTTYYQKRYALRIGRLRQAPEADVAQWRTLEGWDLLPLPEKTVAWICWMHLPDIPPAPQHF